MGLATLLGLLLAWLPHGMIHGASAQDTTAQSPAAGTGRLLDEPSTCVLGVYIQDMRDYQFAQNSLFASIRLWSVCPTDKDSPLADLSVLNANDINLGNLHSEKLKNRSDYFRNTLEVYWSERTVEGTFFHHWSAKNYPFDRHYLNFEFETSKADTQSFVLTPDYHNSGFSPSIQNGEWIARDFSISEITQHYQTNFGRPDQSSSQDGRYSRIKVDITLQRARVTSFLKLCTGVYAAVVIAGIAFMMDMREPDIVSGRTGVLVGCLFAAIVNMQQAEATLGMSEDVTLTDSIHIVSIIYILVASMLAIVSYLRCEKGMEDTAQRLDRKIYLPIYMSSFAVMNTIIIAYAALIG